MRKGKTGIPGILLWKMKLKLMKNNNHLKDNGYNRTEQALIYQEQLLELISNPRWYLDHLEEMVEYRVEWVCYSTQKITSPLNRIKNRKVYK